MKINTKNVWKRMAALLAVCIMLLALPAWSASAWGSYEAYDAEECSITFFGCNEPLTSEAEEYGIDIVMDIYQIAGADSDGNGGYTLYGYNELFNWDEWYSIKNGKISHSLADELTNRAAEVISQNMYMELTARDVGLGDTVDNLEPGAYICFIHERDQSNWFAEYTVNGVTAIVSEIYGKFHGPWVHNYIISPSLVILPQDTNDGGSTAIGPVWRRKSDITPKPLQLVDEELTVYKRDSEGDAPLAGATFNLYCAAADANEEFITVTVDGKEIPLYLLESQITGDSGMLKFATPYPNALYALVETEAPAGYVLSKEPRFFYSPDIKDWAKFSDQTVDSITIDELTLNEITISSEELTANYIALSNSTYRYTFTNETNRDVYVRVKAFSNEFFDVMIDRENWRYDETDGYYYYRKKGSTNDTPLPSDGETEELLIRIDIPKDFFRDPDDYYNYRPPVALAYECVPVSNNPQWNNATSGPYYPEVLENHTITIHNQPRGEELPETGGQGTAALYWTGGLLTAGAVLLLADQKRRKRNSI